MSNDKSCRTCNLGAEFKDYPEVVCFMTCDRDNPSEFFDDCDYYSIMDADELHIMPGDYVCGQWEEK